jgi:dipeptidyl aminopeptidase/acylaminoacyl peptidase
MAPGLVDAGVVFAAVSSDERDNFRQFGADGSASWDGIESRWGKPRENPRFWDGLAARRYADRITEPLLAYHGRVDTTCPPSWARATHRAMRAAGVDMQLRWVDGEGHTFNDPAFYAAMRGTIRFLDRQLE